MGYSIITPFRSEIERDRMLRFITINYRSFTALLTGDLDLEDSWTSFPTHNPSYGSDDYPVIGFDYKSSDYEREYPYRICSWMAMHGGVTGLIRIGESVIECPFLLYDGTEHVFLTKEKPNGEIPSDISIIEVDNFGYYPINPKLHRIDTDDHGIDWYNRLFHQEVQRLDSLWRQANGA